MISSTQPGISTTTFAEPTEPASIASSPSYRPRQALVMRCGIASPRPRLGGVQNLPVEKVERPHPLIADALHIDRVPLGDVNRH